MFIWLSFVFFAAFVLDVLIGKVSILSGSELPVHAGDTIEFLVLFGAVIFFVIATLRQEVRRKSAQAAEQQE